MLVRCLYASRARQPLTPAVVDGILEQSRRNNPARGITGLLCFVDDVFVQVLEGGRDPVCHLFATIFRNDRHSARSLSPSNPPDDKKRVISRYTPRIVINQIHKNIIPYYTE